MLNFCVVARKKKSSQTSLIWKHMNHYNDRKQIKSSNCTETTLINLELGVV